MDHAARAISSRVAILRVRVWRAVPRAYLPAVTQVGQTLTIPLHDGTANQAAAAIGATGVTPAEVNTRPPTLDDVYLQLTGERFAA